MFKALIEPSNWPSFEKDRWAKIRMMWIVICRFKKCLQLKRERDEKIRKIDKKSKKNKISQDCKKKSNKQNSSKNKTLIKKTEFTDLNIESQSIKNKHNYLEEVKTNFQTQELVKLNYSNINDTEKLTVKRQLCFKKDEYPEKVDFSFYKELQFFKNLLSIDNKLAIEDCKYDLLSKKKFFNSIFLMLYFLTTFCCLKLSINRNPI